MATKKINQISIPLHELLECLVNYSEYLDAPPPYAETIPDHEVKPNKRSFILDTPQQKREAIEIILFGDEKIKKKRGNRSLEEHDKALLLEMQKEHGDKIKTKEQLLDLCVPYATLRDENTTDESVRVRLDRVYQKHKKSGLESSESYGYSDFDNNGWDEYVADEIRILSPWLEKYRDAILKYYSS